MRCGSKRVTTSWTEGCEQLQFARGTLQARGILSPGLPPIPPNPGTSRQNLSSCPIRSAEPGQDRGRIPDYPQSRLVARAAPSASIWSLAQATSSATNW